MFYSQFILAKKGPLGTIWIAAHLERKLRKNQVADTDIGDSVDTILCPDMPIALRLSSHLLLGVVRIYSRKVNYLFDDCSEALLKVKQAFRSTAVDLPPEESKAPYHSITLPETFDLDDFELPDAENFQGNYVDHHVSSREQITLQDTMDGVNYSTSQFGLDERFGDGETSQIGLDLEKDIFLNEAAAQENYEVPDVDDPQMSTLPKTLLEKDESYEGISGTSMTMKVDGLGNQDPFIAELVEKTNLATTIQGFLPFNDLLELKDCNQSELVTVECKENSISKSGYHPGDNNSRDWSSCKKLDQESVTDMHSEENGHLSSDVEIKQVKPDECLSSGALTFENMLMENVCSTSLPSQELVESVKPTPLPTEYSNGAINAFDVPDRAANVHNGVVISNEPSEIPADQADQECIDSPRVGLDETVASPSCSQVTTELEDPGRTTFSVNVDIHKNSDAVNNMGESCSPCNVLVTNGVCSVESPGRPEVVNFETQSSVDPKDTENSLTDENMATNNMPALRACNSTGQPDMSLLGGEREHAFCGETPDACRKLDEEMDNAASCDKTMDNLDTFATSVPEPEKMLSVPEGLAFRPNDLLVESALDEVLEEDDRDVAGMKLSGKKRSFTGSTLTVHSLNSIESSGVTRSRRTVESIPDDDDLLSSILVGRKSSVLKMKPPPAPEVISRKRLRSVSRASASKKKVLMDDMMVLHGDTIRQQLTDTEDIRRTRKKAPCTRPEISMIQRQFVEEIFNEPIFTGLPVALVTLHSEAFDLSRISVFEDDQDNTSVEKTTNVELLKKCLELQPAVSSAQNESQPVEDFDLRPHLESTGEIAEMEVDGNNTGVNDVANHSAHGVELPSGPVPEDVSDVPNVGVAQSSLMEDLDTFLQMDTRCLSLEKLDTQTFEDASLANISYERSNDVTEVENKAEARVNNLGMDVTEPFHDSLATESMEAGTCDTDSMGVSNDDRKQSENDNPINVDKEVMTSDVICDDKDPISTSMLHEGVNEDSTFFSDVDVNSISPNAGDNVGVSNDDQRQSENNSPINVDKDKLMTSDLMCDVTCISMPHEGANEDSTFFSDVDVKRISPNAGENAGCQDADPECIMDVQVNPEHTEVQEGHHHDFEGVMVANDTEFLNVDDDEAPEEDDDDIPGAEDTRLLENSGWSSRTRAVAKYLQILFDKEEVRGRKVLPLDQLLTGKTRKEASRMFFETLVLKTKDYINIEQTKSFDNINVKPRTKLIISDF